jgi:hypothetical protein
VPPPKTLANVDFPSTTVVPGVATGWASEMIRVKPSSASSIPSVVMNELMPITAVKKPLIEPTTMQATSARIRLGIRGKPQLVSIS